MRRQAIDRAPRATRWVCNALAIGALSLIVCDASAVHAEGGSIGCSIGGNNLGSTGCRIGG